MITGRKRLPLDRIPPKMASVARAAFLLGCGALVAAALATYL